MGPDSQEKQRAAADKLYVTALLQQAEGDSGHCQSRRHWARHDDPDRPPGVACACSIRPAGRWQPLPRSLVHQLSLSAKKKARVQRLSKAGRVRPFVS